YISFKAARIIVVIEPANDKKNIYVRGQYLFAHFLPGLLSGKLGAPWQHVKDDRFSTQDNPIPNTRPHCICMTQAAASSRLDFAVLRPKYEVLAGSKRHPSYFAVGALIRKKIAPANSL